MRSLGDRIDALVAKQKAIIQEIATTPPPSAVSTPRLSRGPTPPYTAAREPPTHFLSLQISSDAVVSEISRLQGDMVFSDANLQGSIIPLPKLHVR